MVEFFKEFFNVVQIFSMNDLSNVYWLFRDVSLLLTSLQFKKQTANSPNQ